MSFSRYNILLSIFVVIVFSSCKSTKNITIETYVPGNIVIPAYKTDLFVASNNTELDTSVLLKYIDSDIPADSFDTKQIAAFESIIGVSSCTNLYSHFKSVRPINVKNELIHNNIIDWSNIEEHRISRSVLLLVVDLKQYTTELAPYYEKEYELDQVILQKKYGIKINYQNQLLLLNPENKTILDSLTFFQFYTQKTGSETKSEASDYLADSLDYIASVAYNDAYAYAQQIIPSWHKGIRKLYFTGSENMRKAFKYASTNKWPDAIDIWDAIYRGNKNDQIAAKAAYNLAVANEVNGELWKARLWAIRSFRKQESIETSEYANLLYERIQYYKQFE
ncbi:MAG: hypothetical protein HN600_05765 [Bacteroidetes bacterium]|nr:hypothetical protein [Bacteroidota bacterium]